MNKPEQNQNGLWRLRRILGLLSIVIFLLMLADVLFVGRGVDAFQLFSRRNAIVVAEGTQQLRLRVMKGGRFPAVYGAFVKPEVTYRYTCKQVSCTSSRFFLIDYDRYSDPLSDVQSPNSITRKVLDRIHPGQSLEIRVGSTVSYVEVGWDALWWKVQKWFVAYLGWSVALMIGYFLVVVIESRRG